MCFIRFDRQSRTWPAYAFVPFGAGPRNCVGMRLALLEAKMALVALIQHFNIEAAPDTEVSGKYNVDGCLKTVK